MCGQRMRQQEIQEARALKLRAGTLRNLLLCWWSWKVTWQLRPSGGANTRRLIELVFYIFLPHRSMLQWLRFLLEHTCLHFPHDFSTCGHEISHGSLPVTRLVLGHDRTSHCAPMQQQRHIGCLACSAECLGPGAECCNGVHNILVQHVPVHHILVLLSSRKPGVAATGSNQSLTGFHQCVHTTLLYPCSQ